LLTGYSGENKYPLEVARGDNKNEMVVKITFIAKMIKNVNYNNLTRLIPKTQAIIKKAQKWLTKLEKP